MQRSKVLLQYNDKCFYSGTPQVPTSTNPTGVVVAQPTVPQPEQAAIPQEETVTPEGPGGDADTQRDQEEPPKKSESEEQPVEGGQDEESMDTGKE